MVTPFLPLACASLRVAANRGQHTGLRGQNGAPGVAAGGFGQLGRGPGAGLAVSSPLLCRPGPVGGPRTLSTAGAAAAGRTEAGAAHGVTGHPRSAVTRAAAVQSGEAGRAGCSGGRAMERPCVTGPRPRSPPRRPGRCPSLPRSQKVPLQPAGQVQAPLTWSQAAPCSHWHRRPQPGPKRPWGHPETHGPGHRQLGACA